MRYYRSKTGIRSIFKIVFIITLIFIILFGILNIFGEKITQSACDFVFTPLWQNETSTIKSKANFENEFLHFLAYEEENTETAPVIEELKSDSSAIAVNLSALSGKYKNYGGTSVINNTDYDISSLLYSDYKKPQIDKEKPSVLIYHTHTSEEYYGGGSVVDVGNTMAEEFEKAGYKTIHITEYYDKEQFSGAYSRSIKGVEKALEENPSIKLVFDIHRDAITASNGDTYKPVTTVENKNCAQIMFVCGTDEKGLYHPNWRENFKFALDVSRTVGENFGALSRPVNLRGDRFNTHTTKHSFLIEVGSNANTLEEANNAAIYTVKSIIKAIN